MKSHIQSFDYLRAIMSVLVVFWHLGGLGTTGLYTPQFESHSMTLADLINFYLLLLAVPTFFFVSFYLFARHDKSLGMLLGRLSRFAVLALFWTIVFLFIMKGGVDALTHTYNRLLQGPIHAIVAIFSGAGTIYYFFFSLMLLVCIAYLFHSARTGVLLTGFVLSTVFVTALPAIGEANNSLLFSMYWSPIAFLPYVFLSLLLFREDVYIREHRMKIIAVSLIALLLSMVFEWNFSIGKVHFQWQGYAIPPYMRPSLVFAVAIIAICALTTSFKGNPVVKFMSKYSLALFCIHPFYIPLAKKVVGSSDALDNILATALVIIISYLSALILQHVLNKKVLF